MRQPQICRPLIVFFLLHASLGCHLGGLRGRFVDGAGSGEQTFTGPQQKTDRSSAPIRNARYSTADDAGKIVPVVHVEEPPASSKIAQWLKRLTQPRRIPLPLTKPHADDSAANEVFLENHGLGEF